MFSAFYEMLLNIRRVPAAAAPVSVPPATRLCLNASDLLPRFHLPLQTVCEALAPFGTEDLKSMLVNSKHFTSEESSEAVKVGFPDRTNSIGTFVDPGITFS